MQYAVSVLMLGAFIWTLTSLLPKARRGHEAFGVTCSLMIALVALLGWLLLGTGARS
jgi:hypothetical protein